MNEAPGQRVIDAGTSPREIFVNDAGKSILPGPNYLDAANSYDGGNTGRVDEIRAGTIVSQVTATKKWVPTKRTAANGNGASATALIVDEARAFKVGDGVAIVGTADSVKLTDSDTAASAGVAMYLHLDEKSQNSVGHLEFVSPTNTSGSFTTNSGAIIEMNDDDAAASGGVAVYFDEDAAEGSKLLAACPNGKDAFVLDSNGRAIRIKYAASPSGAGVQLYFDEDGATGSRVLYVSPTNANGFALTDSVEGVQSAFVKATGINIDSINYGTKTLTLASNQIWQDGDQVYCSSLAGSEIARGVVTEAVRLLSGVPYETDWRDKAVVVADAGFLDSAQIVGDYAAIRASSDHQLSGFRWLDRQRI